MALIKRNGLEKKVRHIAQVVEETRRQSVVDVLLEEYSAAADKLEYVRALIMFLSIEHQHATARQVVVTRKQLPPKTPRRST